MSDKLELWNFSPSFNSRKARLALGYKGLEYEHLPVGTEPEDREKMVAVSGQPLSPVLVHGDTVIYDSGAILRYLDANLKQGPRLFSADADEMKAIERWESRSKAEIFTAFWKAMTQFRSGSLDETIVDEARREYWAAGRAVEESLNEHGVLVGNAITAADIFCASYLFYGYVTPELARDRPGLKWCAAHFTMDPALERLKAWFDEIHLYDQHR